MTPKIREILTASTAADRETATRAVEANGLCALPAAREALAQLKADSSARPDLQRLVNRLAATVADVRLGKDSAKPNPGMQRCIDEFRGKPLEPAALADFLATAARSLPEGVAGVDTILERDGDDTGIRLEVTLVKAPTPLQRNASGWWSYDQQVNVDQSGVHGIMGSSLGLSAAKWDGFTLHLQRALESVPEKSISSRAKIMAEK